MSHSTSRFFLIIKVILVASIVVAAAWGWQQLKDPENFPINTVKVQASYAHTDQTTLAGALTPYVNQGFFSLNKKALTAAIFSTSPWIAEVKLNRTWPDALDVTIIEQIPVARWENKALINTEGDIFYAEVDTFPDDAPTLIANEEKIPTLLNTYEKIQVILSPIHLNIIQISLTDREAITLTLDNGTEIIVGRKDPLPRLQRFVKVYTKVTKPNAHAETIDLRYQHGLAVKWQEK